MMKDKLLSETITYLRFPLIIGVVFIHFNLLEGRFLVNETVYSFQGNDVGTIKYIILLFSHVLPSVSVPLFFTISGFLFFNVDKFDRETYTNKIKNRIRSLAIPYFLWNLIAFVMKLITSVSSQNVEFHFSVRRLFNTFFYCDNYNGVFVLLSDSNKEPLPIDVPMWYVRDLMLMVIFSPFLYYILKRVGVWFVLIIGLVWYSRKTGIIPNYGYIFLTATFFSHWGPIGV